MSFNRSSEVFCSSTFQAAQLRSIPSPTTEWVDHQIADAMASYDGPMSDWLVECDPAMIPPELTTPIEQPAQLNAVQEPRAQGGDEAFKAYFSQIDRSQRALRILADRAHVADHVGIFELPGLCVHKALSMIGVPTCNIQSYPDIAHLRSMLSKHACNLKLVIGGDDILFLAEAVEATSVVTLNVSDQVSVCGVVRTVPNVQDLLMLHRLHKSIGGEVIAHVVDATIEPLTPATLRIEHHQNGLSQSMKIDGSLFELAAFTCMVGGLPPLPRITRGPQSGVCFGAPALVAQLSSTHKYVDSEAAGYCVHKMLQSLDIDPSGLPQYPSVDEIQQYLAQLECDASFVNQLSPTWCAAPARPLVTFSVRPTDDPLVLHAVSAVLLKPSKTIGGVLQVPPCSRAPRPDVVCIGADSGSGQSQQPRGSSRGRPKKEPKTAGPATQEYIKVAMNRPPIGADVTAKQRDHTEKQLAALERRITALSRNPFLSANFGATSLDPVQLVKMDLSNHSAPTVGIPEALSMLQNVATNWQGHPKLFGPSERTSVLRTTASRILPLTGMSTGDRIYGFFLRSAPYKGAVICRRQPGATSFSILGFVTPNRDPEKLGTSNAALWGGIKVSALQNISGTVTSTATMQVELGHTKDFPVFIESGKMASVCVGTSPAVEVVGTKSYDMMIFNGDWPVDQLIRKSGRDPVNPALITTPNPGLDEPAPTTGQYCVNAFRISASAISAESATVGGFTIGSGSVIIPASTNNYLVWSLAACTQYARHFLFGQFGFKVRLPRLNFSGTSSTYYHVLRITFGDGSTLNYQQTRSFGFGGPALDNSDYWEVDTRGDPVYMQTVGRGIINIEFLLTTSASSNITIVGTTAGTNYRPSVELTFHEVNTEEEYVGFILSGALASGQVSVEIQGETELTIDMTSEIGSFIEATPESPVYPAEVMKQALQIIGVASGNTDQRAFTSSSFTRFLKRATNAVGKFIKPIGSTVLSAVKTANNFMQNPVGNTVDMITGRQRKPHDFGPPEWTNNPDTAYMPQWMKHPSSTSFGEGVIIRNQKTHMRYPAVREIEGGFDFIECSIEIGRGNAPDFVRELGLNLCSDKQTVGRSCELAFALAAARQLGFNVRDGLYTGQVDDFFLSGDECSFVISPVDDRDEKLVGSQDLGGLTGLFLDGWYERNRRAEMGAFSFGTRVRADVECIPAAVNGDVKTNCYKVIIRNI